MDKTQGTRRGRPGPRAAPWAKAAAPPAELPPGLPARLVAASLLAEILAAGHGLDDALASDVMQGRLQALDLRDRALVRSIVIVSLRHLGTIRKTLAQLIEKGLPKRSGNLEWILVITAAQVMFMDVPDHAAVNLCVQAVRQDPKSQPFAALANAVARNLTRRSEIEGVVPGPEPFIDTPAWLAARWKQTYGPERAAAIAAAHAREAALDITPRREAAVWAERLAGRLLPTGSIRIGAGTSVPDLPGYADGEWWVQDAAAALPARLLRVEPGQRVADLCAAPGGKTAQLVAAGGEVVAVDRSAERLKRLKLNLERLNMEADTTVADVVGFSAAPFDAILLDAPCTATGTIRRHPDVAWTKRASDIPTLTALQAKMLDRAFTLLKPGGTLVYCVCSLEPDEGEMQIATLLRRNPDVERVPVSAAEVGGLAEAVTPLGELRTLPFMRVASDPDVVGLRWLLRRPAATARLGNTQISAAKASRLSSSPALGSDRPGFTPGCSARCKVGAARVKVRRPRL